MGVSTGVEFDDSLLEASRVALEEFSAKAWSVGGLEFEGGSRASGEAAGVVLGGWASDRGVSEEIWGGSDDCWEVSEEDC